MKESANLLNDSEALQLGKDLDAISDSRKSRSTIRDFESYLDFIESASSLGVKEGKKKPLEIGNGPLIL